MKHIRKFTALTILFVIIVMMIVVCLHQGNAGESSFSEQIGYYFNEGWTILLPDGGVRSEVSLPYAGSFQDADKIVFQNTLSEEYAGRRMVFSYENADVRVLFDGEVLNLQEPERDNGGDRYYVNLPDMDWEAGIEGKIEIELTILDYGQEIMLGDVIVETGDVIIIGLRGSNLVDIVCSLLIMISAIIMLVLAMMRWYTGQPSRGESLLGLFGLTASIYCFIGTDPFELFFIMQEAYLMQEYLMLVLPLFLVLYFERNFRSIYPHRFNRLLCAVICNAVIQVFADLSGVCNLAVMANVSAVVMAVVCVAVLVSLIKLEKKNWRLQNIMPIASVFVLLAGEVAKVILKSISMYEYVEAAVLYTMTLSGLLLAILHVSMISREYRENAEEKARAAQEQNILLAQAKKDADAARQEALAANEAKGKFLAHMSHEIRTPINAVLGMDEMILRESKEPQVREYAMDIYTAGQSLLSLINDILDFSKIDSGKMEIVPVAYDVSSLIHDLVNMTTQRAAAKDLRLEVEIDHEIPSRLFGDDVRIRQILINILTNAVKYTHEGTIWFRIKCRLTEETAVLYFEVEDTGIGIKEEDLPKLSAEFERIEEDRNRNIEGTGLGMSITMQLLSLLGSRLQVESVYGKGSKFYFALEQKIVDHTPLGDFESKVQKMAQDFSYESGFCAPDAKILVVDDNAVNRKVLRNLLKETQMQVTEADGGEACLRLVQENHYDLIFLDHMMPGMDGVETLHHIKELSEFPCQDTPIVVLTANAVSGAKEFYLTEGFDDFLSKPIVPDKLESMIQKMLPEELLHETVEKTEGPSKDASAFCLEELPVVEGLDWNYAWLHLPEEELLAYTVKTFYEQIDYAADRLEQIQEQSRAADYLEQYRIQVHAMKGLAATVGIIPLAGIARVLEAAAKDGKIEIITALTGVFLEEWRSYRIKLQGVFDIGSADGAKKDADYSVIQALVEMVRISLQEMDIDQADEAMRQLQEYDCPDRISQCIQKLAEAVTNLDMEETDRLADLLSEEIEKQRAQ